MPNQDPNSSQRLAGLLGLRPGEIRRTLLASLFHLAFVAAVVLVKSASNALVVSRFQADALPPLYIATALVTGCVAALAAWFERGRIRRLPRIGLIFATIILGGLAAATSLRLPLAVTALYLFGETFATLVSIRFWGAASELFDARASKRAFGVLGAAGMAGAIVAGLAAQLLGARLGAVGLLPPAIGLLVLCTVLAMSLRMPGGRQERQGAPPPTGVVLSQARAYLTGDRYPRALAGLMVLLAVLTAFADYLFRVRAGAELGEAEMASLFGALNLWMGVVAVLFQLALAGRVLERWGIFRYLLVTPLGSAIAAISCLFVPGIAPAFALRLVESSGSLSLNPAAFQLLYGPVPDAIRPHIRSVIDGFVKKLGFAAGGALLLLLGGRATVEALAALVVGVVLLIAVGLLRTRGLYVGAIEARLSRASGRNPAQLRSAEARQVLLRSLRDREPVRVLTAVAILEGDPRFDPMPHLQRLLEHSHERIRLAAIRLARARRITPAAPHLERLLAEDIPRIRQKAALALAHLAPQRAEQVLRPLLADSDPGLVGAAIAALVPLQPAGGEAATALRQRLEMGPRAPAVERRETARVLGRLGPSPEAIRLLAYLDDPDLAVRRSACVAAGKTREPALVEGLLSLLGDRAVRSSARTALATYGDAVVAKLAALLDDRDAAMRLRLEIPGVLRRIGTKAAARALLFSNIQEHAYLRYRIAVNLSRLHEEHPEVGIDMDRAREATIRRLDAYHYYLPLYRDLEVGLPAGAPLVRAVGDRLQQNLEVIFRLLQLMLPESAIIPAWRHFAGGDARERAYAIELIDHLLDDELKARLLPLLDRYHRLPEAWGGIAGKGDRAPARVLEIAVSRDVMLRAIALRTAVRTWPDNPPLPPGVGKDEMDAVEIERVFFLEGVEIFGRCDVDDLVALASIAREREYGAEVVIFDEGDAADALYVILEGHVRFEKAGREVLTVGTRDSFGESSLLDGAPRPVRAVAHQGEVRVLSVDRNDFLELVSDRPELLRGIFAAVSRHLRQVLDRTADDARGGEATPAKLQVG